MSKIEQLESEIAEKITRLHQLRKQATAISVKNYQLKTLTGSASLLDLFADKSKLLVIHNMGQGCRYCT